jgi:hypothetical protein
MPESSASTPTGESVQASWTAVARLQSMRDTLVVPDSVAGGFNRRTVPSVSQAGGTGPQAVGTKTLYGLRGHLVKTCCTPL